MTQPDPFQCVAEPRLNKRGWYILPDPDDPTKTVEAQRTTNFARTLSDSYGLQLWKQRKSVQGLLMSPQLQERAKNAFNARALDRVIADAQVLAGSKEKANIGSYIHKISEFVDRGAPIDMKDKYAPELVAYRRVVEAHGITYDPLHIERVVFNRALHLGGMLDRIGLYRGQHYIVDIKTGSDLSHGWGDIAIQLAVYAKSYGMVNAEQTGYDGFPPGMNVQVALVVHVPQGEAERAAVYWVDIEAGWNAAHDLVRRVKDWRVRTDLAEKVD